ncbi:hypothetical protein HO173_011059 [Letharia columbiana]|uniref:NADH dehydrogenase [ubiquinone] 1 beta subcomplex subunit 4 n=1 Tax=Letharia columbiana TaxID=112416 RepID=A0A8H6FLF6_9LECA|nr:uncharacterized protein HO173_011059 [Letharia columbiana]KAF6230707.1 hypothetical protein HO173_011059 [Letharia columbiana]
MKERFFARVNLGSWSTPRLAQLQRQRPHLRSTSTATNPHPRTALLNLLALRPPINMAGHNNSLAMDPALVKYNNMSANRWRYFRWTPRTAWITFVYVVAVPSVVGYVGFVTEGKYELRGKRRGDIIREF